LAGCLDGPRSLSELHGTRALVSAQDTLLEYPNPQQFPPAFSVLLETPDCAPLEPDATASFAGIPLELSRFGHDGGCTGWRASLNDLAPGVFDNASTVLVIRDRSETWTIDVPGLHDAGITLSSQLAAGQPASVTWTGGPMIWAGRLHLDTGAATYDVISTVMPGWQFPTTTGDPAMVMIPPAASGTARASIELDGTVSDSGACQGPASCEIDESVSAAFDVTVGG
jgi:hypothetical protein